MGFIMSVLGKLPARIPQAIVLVCCLHSLVAQADFELTGLEAMVDSSLLQVDATANLSLSNETQQALESGVDLRIQFLIELMKSRNWFWDSPKKRLGDAVHIAFSSTFRAIYSGDSTIR